MKQELIVLSLIVATVFSACTEKKNMEFPPVDESGYTLITADIESLLFMEGKTVWPEDAAIGVYGTEKGNNEYYTIKEAGAGYSSASFYGPLVKGQITAYYPYNSSYVGSAEAMPVYIKDMQVFDPEVDIVANYLAYTPNAYGYMYDDKIKFVYPNGVLSLSFEGDEPVYITDITVLSDSQSISGHAILNADGTLEMTSNSSNSVLLDCGEGASSIVSGKPTEFNLVLAPGTYSDLRLSIGFKGNDKKFLCNVPEVTIKRITAEGFVVTSMKITTSVPDGFVEENVEFDE
jgi:hypothetical protein